MLVPKIYPNKFLEFTCPVCYDDCKVDIESGITYSEQCDTGKHFVCNECTKMCKKRNFDERKDYICVVCKNKIITYIDQNPLLEENEVPNVRSSRPLITEIPIQRSINIWPISFGFHLIFLFIFILIGALIKITMNIKVLFITGNVLFGIFYMIRCFS
jgi:hypothetical protein